MVWSDNYPRIFFRVCQCLWVITNFVFKIFCLCKFVREPMIVLFPLNKILEPISWNNCNFSMVIEAIPGCNMKKPPNIRASEMV